MSESEPLRYPGYEPQVNAILDVARAARNLARLFPNISPTDLIQHLDPAARDWCWSLIEIIMDYEDRAECAR